MFAQDLFISKLMLDLELTLGVSVLARRDSMKHFYMMRHGETVFNVRRKIQGWCDSALTEKGIQQAKAAYDLIKDIPFDHYYSSTSERCCDTLEYATRFSVPYVRLKGLKERNFGLFEGESEDLNPHFEDFGYDELFPHYDGETLEEVKNRVRGTVDEFMNKDDHEVVLACSHSGASFAFFLTVSDNLDYMYEIGAFKNGCILHYTYDNGVYEFVEILRPEA